MRRLAPLLLVPFLMAPGVQPCSMCAPDLVVTEVRIQATVAFAMVENIGGPADSGVWVDARQTVDDEAPLGRTWLRPLAAGESRWVPLYLNSAPASIVVDVDVFDHVHEIRETNNRR